MRLGHLLTQILQWGLQRFGVRLVRTMSRRVGPYAYEDVAVKRYAPWLTDPAFQAVYQHSAPHTLVDIYRCYELWDLVKEVRDVPGDILEVGVWRGGTGAVLAAAANRWKPTATVYLCETFTGVVKAGPFDPDYHGGEHADTSPAQIRALLTNLNLRQVRLIQGIFPDQTESQVPAERIALCHIDVDVYDSAKAIVEWVRTRMELGAVLVFDDYGFQLCQGITRLVDEWREVGGWQFVYNLNGHALLIKR